MSHWYIIGKHPRGQHYKRFRNWKDVKSIGLNEAAYIYGTKYAMTGHNSVLQKLYENGYTTNVIIPDAPFDPFMDIKHECLTIKHAGISDKHNHPYELIREMVADAIAKKDRPYFDFWTVLHLAISYVLIEGAKEITLIGCNQTPGFLPGMLPGKRIDYALHHTELMVDACRELGIKVNWLK